jgi:RNA-binding protein
MLTSKERAALKASAVNIEPIMQIGKEGVSTNSIKQIDDALEARELIKITVLKNCEYTAKDLFIQLSKAVKAEPVQVIGNKIIIYRKRKEK